MDDVNDFTYWQAALAAKAERLSPESERHAPPMAYVDDPQPGRYWMRRYKNGPRLPVAIWKQDGVMVALVGFKGSDQKFEADAAPLWSWCSDKAITDEVYQQALAEGRFASDLPAEALPPVQKKAPAVVSRVIDVDAAMADMEDGHAIERANMEMRAETNHPPEQTEFESLKEQLETVKKNIAALPKVIASAADAELVQGYRARLLELKGQFDKRREALKRPHLEAGKTIDNLWNPQVKDAAAEADELRVRLRTWETAEFKRQQAERAAMAPPVEEYSEDANPPVAPVTPTKTKIAGGYGKAASVSSVRVITKVTDYDAIYAHFANRQDLQDFLLGLATKAVKGGDDVPGCEIETQRDVR